MINSQVSQKNEYAKCVSLFLAELLRTKKIELSRAAEIAQKVVDNINLIDTERDFLSLVKELSRDFQELFPLGDSTDMHIHVTKRQELEGKVRQFAVENMANDINLSLQVLQEAINDKVVLDDLCVKFPQFKQFIENNRSQYE